MNETPNSTLVEGAFLAGLFVFAIAMLVWYFRECQKIDRESAPIDQRLEALRIKHQQWLDDQEGKS